MPHPPRPARDPRPHSATLPPEARAARGTALGIALGAGLWLVLGAALRMLAG